MIYGYLLLFFILTSVSAQKKKISLEDIWLNGSFTIETLESFKTMKTGEYYTALNKNSYGWLRLDESQNSWVPLTEKPFNPHQLSDGKQIHLRPL